MKNKAILIFFLVTLFMNCSEGDPPGGLMFLAKIGHSKFQLRLAQWYYAEEDYEKSLIWSKRVAEKGIVYGYTITGNNYVELGDFEEALKWFEPALACSKGNAEFFVGMIYAIDLEPPDFDRAFHFFLNSAEQGHDASCFILGINFYEGDGRKSILKLEKDLEKAEFWLLKSIELSNGTFGTAQCFYFLGLIYKDRNSLDKAKEYFQKAINLADGYKKAEKELASMPH